MTDSTLKIKIGILAASTLIMVPVGLVGIIPGLIAHYAAGVTMIQIAFTLATVMSIPSLLIIGSQSAKTGKKPPLLIGICLIFVFGMIPFLFDITLPVFMVVMAVIGIGIGCVMSMSTGLITDHFQGAEQGALMGKQSAFVNVGGMTLAFLGGLLIVNGWMNVFLVFLYTIPIFIICLLCIPKDKKQVVAGDANAERPKIKLSAEVYIMCVMIIVITVATLGVANTNSAILVGERALGGDAVANFATSIMTGTGIVTGLLYGVFAKFLKNNILPFALIVFACGMIIMGNAVNVWMFYLGNMAAGVGLTLTMPTGVFRCAQSVEGPSATFAVSVFFSANMLGMFLSPLLMNPISMAIADGSAQSRYNIGFVVAVLIGIWMLVHVRRTAPKA